MDSPPPTSFAYLIISCTIHTQQTAGLLRDYKKAAKIVEKLKEQIQQIEEQKVAKEAGLSDIQNISKDIREKMEDARSK